MPVCNPPKIGIDERVVVLNAGEYRQDTDIKASLDAYFGTVNEHLGMLDIELDTLNSHITLVLSSSEDAIFRFKGDTNNVNRVIILGSTQYGIEGIGTVGIEKNKIEYVPVVGNDSLRTTVCSAPPKACIPDQFFEIDYEWASASPIRYYQISPPYRNLLSVTAASTRVFGAVSVKISEDSSGININPTPYKHSGSFARTSHKELFESYNEYGMHLKTRPPIDRTINPDDIIALSDMRKAETLPSWHGIMELHDSGAVLIPSDEEFGTKYDAYVAQSSEWYEERLPKIDLILIDDIDSLPRNISAKREPFVIFVPTGVSVPKLPISQSNACFLYESYNSPLNACPDYGLIKRN